MAGGGGSGDGSTTITCSGTVTATFTWQGSAANLPTYAVVVLESKADASGIGGASAINGLGDTTTTTTTGQLVSASCGTDSSGVAIKHIVLKPNPGSSFTVTVTPDSSGNISVGAWVRATVYPITVDILGLINSTSTRNALIGQALRASVSLPPNFPLGAPTSFTWTIPTNIAPFSSYTVAYPPTSATYVGIVNPSTTTGSSFDFRAALYADAVQVTVSISFGSTTLSNLQSSNFNIDRPRSPAPIKDCGHMQLLPSSSAPDEFFLDGLFYAGQNHGIYWADWVEIPTIYTSPGYFDFVQLLSDKTTMTIDGVVIHVSPNDDWKLDGYYPYNGDFTKTEPINHGKLDLFRDRPGVGGISDPLNNGLTNITFDANFKTYLIFIPPANSVGVVNMVPLRRMTWRAKGMATKIGSGPAWSMSSEDSRFYGGMLPFPPHPIWPQAGGS